MNKWIGISLIFTLLLYSLAGMSQKQRFPKPEFGTGYHQPTPVTPEPRALALEYTDVFVLLIVLSLASWIAIRRRSRKEMLWLSVFTLIYLFRILQGWVYLCYRFNTECGSYDF